MVFIPPTKSTRRAELSHLSNSIETKLMARDIHGLGLTSFLVSSAEEFEPVVNVPALGAVTLIFIVYTFLLTRGNAIEDAAEKRKKARANLKQMKSEQLAGSDLGLEDARFDSEKLSKAIVEYEQALRDEEEARTILPGIRIRSPVTEASRSDEDIVAAKQYLGIDLDQAEKKVEPRLSLLYSKDGPGGFSIGAIAVQSLLVLCLLGVFVLNTMDPMTSNEVLTRIDALQ